MIQKLKQDMEIGSNLRNLRQKCKLTQEQVVAKLQVLGFEISREILSQIENGRYSIRISLLVALKSLYGVSSYDEIFMNL